ncbi:MAG: NAD-dependent epimerase/dehydratase family protein [Bacteroidota bacterium]
MPRTAFVTGGTGFLGINLLHALAAQGWELTVLHRKTSKLTYIQDLPIKLVEGSITDKASLQAAIPQDTEVVFHLAGDTNMWSKYNDRQREINVDGTQYMIEVALEKGVNTFIHTSSIAAWGEVKGVTKEDTPQLGASSSVNYERTKWEGEQIAKAAADKGMKVVIINPAGIVGKYDAQSWAQIFFALRDGKMPGVPPGDNSFVHVDDVVTAHIMAVDKGRNGENYLVTGQPGTIQDLAVAVANEMGMKKVPPKMPKFLLSVPAHLMGFFGRITGIEPTMTPEIVSFMSRKDYAFSQEKAIREFGYTSKPWQEGIRDCHQWLKEEGLL